MASMSSLIRREIAGIPVSDLVRDFGTPSYKYDAALITEVRAVKEMGANLFTQEEGGFVRTQRLPEARVGDHLLIENTGAYGFVMSSNYNTRPRAAEVMVDGGRFGVARPRESAAALFADENPTPLE